MDRAPRHDRRSFLLSGWIRVGLVLLAAVLASGLWLLGGRLHLLLIDGAVPDVFSIRVLLGHLLGGLLLTLWLLSVPVCARLQTPAPDARRFSLPKRRRLLLLAVMPVTGILMFIVPSSTAAESNVARSGIWWLHVLSPLMGLLVWKLGRPSSRLMAGSDGRFLTEAIVVCLAIVVLMKFGAAEQSSESSGDSAASPFAPSPARTSSGQPLTADRLVRSNDCLICHQDVHAGWEESAHHFSSFNNPAYLASFNETRRVTTERGDDSAVRWCAGCHDPVPLLSGRLDQPDFDMTGDATADAGITCTVCHSITDVHSTQGNGSYTIEDPQDYPFADSDAWLLRWISHQLVRTRPAVHQHTYLKPIHAQAEFCSACHKVHIPQELNRYREFLRGQNHYDSWLLSGVSGHSARSFYYPEVAEQNCNGCHMPQDQEAAGHRSHLFPAANTALPWLRNSPETVAAHQSFLQGAVDVDLFGIREGEDIDSRLTAPLRPHQPVLEPGRTYLLETVIRTLDVGHHFTQGTTDSNQVWLELTVSAGDEVIAASGQMDGQQQVDSQAHFVNTFMLDRHGQRIDRRNVQDIFVPLYEHQIPPGAAQSVHYRLTVPVQTRQPLAITARLLYRKFDLSYFQFIADSMRQLERPLAVPPMPGNPLPVTVLAEDTVTLPVRDRMSVPADLASSIPEWRRWNDYGIGLLLKGRAELRQAAAAFRKVEELGRFDGPLNLARVLIAEGGDEQLVQAADALRRATKETRPAAPAWTVQWLQARIHRQQGNLPEAERLLRQILRTDTPETRRRGFDFSRDYIVNNLLGQTVFDQALRTPASKDAGGREQRLQQAADIFQQTLQLDSENVDAHHNLAQLYQLLQQPEQAARHRALHQRYRPDDTARAQAVEAAGVRYPHAETASEPVVIYELRSPIAGD